MPDLSRLRVAALMPTNTTSGPGKQLAATARSTVSEMASAIGQALETPGGERPVNGRSTILERFSVEHQARAHLELYHSLLEGAGRARVR